MTYTAFLDSYDSTPRDVVVIEKDYPAESIFPVHTHQRGQFAYATSGVITVFTDGGNWVVPPQRAFWVPAGVPHEMHMQGPVTMLNTYLRSEAAQAAGLPSFCQVFSISPLLRNLLREAVCLPPLYKIDQREGRIMALLLDEIAVMPSLPLSTPLPNEPRLARVCRQIIDNPTLDISINEMASRTGMSRRTFTRLFREHTGVSFIVWRQQACLLASLTRLSNGESITRVATDLGYSSPSAFSVVFRRALGESPSRYVAGIL
jgi:AraC-like DNA-binding protein